MSAAAGRLLGAGLLVVALLAPPSANAEATGATPAEADYQRVNAALVENHVLPRYRLLADAMAGLDEALHRYCEAPGAAALERARAAYGAALDGWMGVQHLQFGPVELFMRSYRLYFWPQGRGRIGGAVDELLAAADPAALEEQRFRNASTAVQGLPALEHLLFGPAAEAAPSAYRCRLLLAVADNVKDMASDILAEWQGGEIDFAGTVAAPGAGNPYFETAQEASLAFFQSLYNGLELVADARLKPALGESLEAAKPQLAESRPSGRSLRNLVVNLEALRGLYEGEGGPGLGALAVESGTDPELDPLLRKAFRLTVGNARSVGRPLAEAVRDPKARPALEKLQTQLSALRQLLRGRFSGAAGLAVGFNSMDGD